MTIASMTDRLRAAHIAVALLFALAADRLPAQALPSVTSLYVGYNTRKVSANPTGDLKARLDSVDRELQTAVSLGQMSQVRRLLAKGNVLLAGRPWTDVADYNSSLVIRSDRSLVESQTPYVVRIEQLYAPAIELKRSLTARATLSARAPGSPPNSQPEVVKTLGNYTGVSRDLRESPFPMEFNLRDVPDGRYVLNVVLQDSTRTLGSASMNIALRRGLDAAVKRLDSAAAKAPAQLRAELLFPVDRMKKVNRGELELRTWNSAADFAAADSVLLAVRDRHDPFAARTGDIKRHYMLDSANEIMPYRLYVPRGYTHNKTAVPVIVALHGLGATEDSFFDGYGKALPALAEEHGYILVAPLGYRVDGGYGWGVGSAPDDAAARRASELSELDVMQALDQVRSMYNIDSNRIYLMGHSMGAIGTWKIAAKYPDLWAAIGMFAGQGVPSTVPLIKNIPAFVVHGDADPTVNVRGSRAMVDAMKVNKVDHVYIEVPGGTHSNIVEPNLARMVRFFAEHTKK